MAGLALLASATAPAAAEREACAVEPGGRHGVARVIDGETIVLDDAREVRLIGALAPRALDVGADPGSWPPEQRAHQALTTLIEGRSIELGFAGRRADRYGRLLAHVFRIEGAERLWVQAHMVASGHARAYGLPGSLVCLAELTAHERIAREAQVGLWEEAAYRVRPATRPRELLRFRGTYQVVEGVIASASEVRGRLYLNFGADWREDFTAAIEGFAGLRRTLGIAAAAELEGRRVEVRGWIERRGGPFLALQDAAQIVVLDESGQRPGLAGTTAGPAGAETGGTPAPRRPLNESRPVRKAPGGLDL